MDQEDFLKGLSDQELSALERGIQGERKAREQREQEDARNNQVARLYHEQVPCEMSNGAAVWQRPAAPVMAYPSGFMVWHNGVGWINNQPGVNMTEPGAEGHTWTTWEETGSAPPLTPEDFPEPEPEVIDPDPEVLEEEVIDPEPTEPEVIDPPLEDPPVGD